MPDSAAFEFVCSALERRTDLDRLQARGTVRLALKEAGLDARSAGVEQMQVVVDRVLPRELESRGVADADALCADLVLGLEKVTDDAAVETPETVFRRLGRS